MSEVFIPKCYYVYKHEITGKKYFGQHLRMVSEDGYIGSGRYWKNYIKKYGEKIVLLWERWVDTREDAISLISSFENENGHYWLPENKEWANLIPETIESNVFQNPKSNPNNIPYLKEKMVEKAIANMDRELATANMKKTKNSIEWKETTGKKTAKKISDTLLSDEFFENNSAKCEWCGIVQTTSKIAQYHGDRCKNNPNRVIVKRRKRADNKRKCPHCGLVGGGGNMTRYHFDNCKSK